MPSTRILVFIAIVAALARADTQLNPEVFLQQFQPRPLECYQTNNVTGVVALEPCQVTNTKSAFHRNNFPVCMMVKNKRGKIEQTCMIMPLLSVVDCDPTTCFEAVHPSGHFSSCCCLTSRCNDGMQQRPKAVLQLPDEE